MTLAVALAWSLASAAVAQSDPDPEPPAEAPAETDDEAEARLHFAAGRMHFGTAHYAEALTEFQRAYELSERPELFFNIYLTYERMGDLPRAVSALERYLSEAVEVPDRDMLTVRLSTLRDRAATEAADAEANDGDEQAAPTPVALAPDDASAVGPAAIASFVAGGVGVLAFAVFGALVAAGDADLDAGCLPAGRCGEDDLDRQDTFALLADIGLGVGVVGGALGLVFVLTHDGGAEGPGAPGPTTTLAPVLTPSFAGLVAHGAL